ncbi:hypothetical protein [Halapricum desulfuricans]|uniref:Uncharacterized protein n=1 Tax=Halapricum desulfuricans TaxID=2841257 RepID=A0A897NUG7_9EURY|nr:hypothetical protein [Halapricum desulfuricans]QSG14359.1 hypothetical protein HSEST_0815 [Halapricum desulfuricans]
MGRSPRYLRSINGSEVAQNDLVAGLLDESLRYGPELLNAVHGSEIGDDRVFSDDTQLLTAQGKIDSQSERELDWVFRDDGNLLVGYESKKGATLGSNQLYNEGMELSRVATDEPVVLVVVTDHSREPDVIADAKRRLGEDDLSVDIRWISWNQFLERLEELDRDKLQPQHEPLVDQLERALSDEGYGQQFSELVEFDDELVDRFINQQDQLVGLIQDLDRLAPEIGLERYSSGRMEIYHWGGSKSLHSLTNSRNPLAPENMMVPFVPKGFDDHPEGRGTSSGYPGVHLNLLGSAVEVGFHFRPNENEQHRQKLLESSEQFVSLVREHNLSLFSFWESWGISNEHHSPEEIEATLTEEGLSADDGYQRLLFGWRVEYQGDGSAFLKEILDYLSIAFRLSWRENRELFYPDYSEE